MSSFYSQSLNNRSFLLGKRGNPFILDLEHQLQSQFTKQKYGGRLFESSERIVSYDFYPTREENNRISMQEEFFGKNSDTFEKGYQQDTRGYAADKRFAPAGPRPPVPPVGGQITFNDAADTIKTNQRCLQSFSQIIYKKQNI